MASTAIARSVQSGGPELGRLGRWEMKISGQDTNNSGWLIVEDHSQSNDVVSATVAFLPRGVTQQGRTRLRGRGPAGAEIATQYGSNAEGTKESIADARARDTLSALRGVDQKAVVFVDVARAKNRVQLFPIHVVGPGKVVARSKWNAFEQRNEARRILIRQRLEERRVNKGKN